mgnify:CR=1 FL=1
MPSKIQTMMPTTMTQTITMPVFSGYPPGGPRDLLQLRPQLPEEPGNPLANAGLFFLVGFGFCLFLVGLGRLVSFAFSSAPSWFIFSFSDIQFHPSFLQGMWAIIT